MSLVVTAAEMREMDRLTIEDAGIPGLVLMENAGRQVAEAVAELDAAETGPVVILCGRGNNGGDGFVAARYLRQWGADVHCLLVGRRDAVKGDALTNLDIVDTLGISVVEAADRLDEPAETLLEAASVFVDALYGTGLTSDIKGLTRKVIQRVNDSEAPVVAVDLPSGISADTGAVLGVAIEADITVTFGFRKRGLLVHPGCDYAGDVRVADIGIPDDVTEHVAPTCFTNELEAPFLPPRPRDSHKGHYGHVLVVGGSPGKAGAVLLAGLGAYRSGAGLVTVLTDARCQPSLEGRVLELMVEAGWAPGAVDAERLRDGAKGKGAVVIGPGLDPGDDGRAVLAAFLGIEGLTLVIDASGLAILAGHPALLAESVADLVLTPHPGEAAALLGVAGADVQADRFGALARLVEGCGGVVALKGSRTLIGAGEACYINLTGNAGMATGGTGDVLAGVLGAFVARGLDRLEAARLAVYVHGLAGDRAAERLGEDGLIASDLLAELPAVLKG